MNATFWLNSQWMSILLILKMTISDVCCGMLLTLTEFAITLIDWLEKVADCHQPMDACTSRSGWQEKLQWTHNCLTQPFKCQSVMLTCSSHWGLVGRTCWHAHHAIEPHQSGNDAKLANQIAEEIVGSCLNYNIWLIDSIIRKMLDLNLLPQEMLIKHSLTMPCRYQTNEGHCHCFSLWLWLYLSLCLVYGCNDSCRKPWPQNIHFEHAKNVHFTCIILP